MPAWLHAEPLARVWRVVGEALERRDLVARGRIVLRDLTREERHALSDVLGQPVTAREVRLDLASLEVRVGARTGTELAELVAVLTGRSLVDRAGRRRDRAARREVPFEAASSWLGEREERSGAVDPWVADWLDGLRRDGILTPWADAVELVLGALGFLESRGVLTDGRSAEDRDRGIVQPPKGIGEDTELGGRVAMGSRTELAARSFGDAHALDDGTRMSALLLRAAAARVGSALPRGAADRRSLWESIGVVNDRVSTTCLSWGVVSRGDSLGGGGRPVHLTWWDLEEDVPLKPPGAVLVCENPRTLEAVASSGVVGLGVVCTMGRPNLVVMEVLSRLATSRVRLSYHGDFDWAGIALANACIDRFGAEPWLMSATDYLAGEGSQRLKGTPVEAAWDPELGAAMRHRGIAVHEEAQLDLVIGRCPELRT